MSSIIKTNKTRKTFGFTLVELIVVITILVILGTIAFIQLGGFASSARDSARVSDMNSIMQGLELVLVKNGVVIPPDASDKGVITIAASGTTIGYQGYAGANVLSSIKMSDARDPLDKKYYTYVTNATYSKYQVLGLMEDSSTLTYEVPHLTSPYKGEAFSTIPLLGKEGLGEVFIDTVYAGYETRIPTTKGSSLGVLLGNTGVTLNMPVQENYSASFSGVDLFTQVFTGSSNFSIAGEALNSVSSSPESCNTWIKSYPSLLGKDGTYRIKPSKTSSTLSVYCDMTTDGGGWSLVGNFRKTGEPYNIGFTGDLVKGENGKFSDDMINILGKTHFLFSVVGKTEKLYCKNFIFDFSGPTLAFNKTVCSRSYNNTYTGYVTNYGWMGGYPISHWNARDLWLRDDGNNGTRIQMDDGTVQYGIYDIKMFAK